MPIYGRSASVRRTLAAVGMVCVLAVGCTDQGARRASSPALPPSSTPTLASARIGIDGSLAYARDGDIYVADWDGSNPVKIAGGLPLTEEQIRAYLGSRGSGSRQEGRCGPGEYWTYGPIWSPDGRFLAYRHTACDARKTRGAWSDVVISDRAGKVISRFPSEGWGIAWSPDSLRVAVWDHWDATIGVYGVDGARQTLLRAPRGSSMGETDPMWSPDGESILLESGLAIPLDGGPPRLLPFWEPDSRWIYSPDGRRVALVGRGSFAIAEPDGSNPQEVLGVDAWLVVWSPAGDRIAFARGGSLRVLEVATGTTTLVTEVDGSIRPIDFSPRGDRILLWRSERGDRGAASLWSVNLDGSDLRLLLSGTSSGDWIA